MDCLNEFDETGLERLQRKAREATKNLTWEERGYVEAFYKNNLPYDLMPIVPGEMNYVQRQLDAMGSK